MFTIIRDCGYKCGGIYEKCNKNWPMSTGKLKQALLCYYKNGKMCIILLTAWSRVPLEKLTVLQLVKKFPAFYGIRRFLTALTSARHLSLS
jgi:hypothetical protein